MPARVSQCHPCQSWMPSTSCGRFMKRSHVTAFHFSATTLNFVKMVNQLICFNTSMLIVTFRVEDSPLMRSVRNYSRFFTRRFVTLQFAHMLVETSSSERFLSGHHWWVESTYPRLRDIYDSSKNSKSLARRWKELVQPIFSSYH